jgi:hypothetical protein
MEWLAACNENYNNKKTKTHTQTCTHRTTRSRVQKRQPLLVSLLSPVSCSNSGVCKKKEKSMLKRARAGQYQGPLSRDRLLRFMSPILMRRLEMMGIYF